MAGLNLPSLMIKILADGSGAVEEIKNVRDAVVELTNVGAQMTKFTTVPIVAALTAAVKSAGDFTETLGKTEVVFGEMTDSVMRWSESSVQAMGLAQSTALEMASTYGDMATGMGLATTEAAEMSMGITQLAADIASFKNKSIGDVNTSMMGVFTGETESLKQLGIVMTQTNLEAFALSQGITKSLSSMSQAEQVQLRYAYVMAQSSNAQGDFVRTGDSLNNQTRKLTETIKQLANEFGAPLTEKVAGVVAKLQGAAQWLAELDDGTKSTILNIGMLVAAAGPLLMVGGKVLSMLSTMKTTLLTLTANPVVLGVAGVIAALSALKAISQDNRNEIDRTSADFKRLKGIVEGGASGEITIDDSQVTELQENPPTVDVKINTEFSESEETAANIEAFQAKVDSLPKNETYSATGEFKVTEATTETINDYAAALAAAATATGDYAEAVDNLNSIVDSEQQRKIAEVNEQIAAEAQYQAGQLAAGAINEDQAQAAVEKAIADGEERIAQIKREAEAQKELNETYANGVKADDKPTAAKSLLGMFEGTELTDEQRNLSYQRLAEANKGGTLGDEQSQIDAQITLNSLRKEAASDLEALADAAEKYDTAIATADTNEQTVIENSKKQSEMYAALLDAAGAYYGEIARGEEAEKAMKGVLGDYAEELAKFEGAENIFKNLFTGENGELLGSEQIGKVGEVFDSIEAMGEDSDAQIEAAQAEAIAAREAALTEFQTTLSGIQEGFTSAEAAGALAIVEQAGVAVSELDSQMIVGGSQAIADLASAIESGSGDVSAAIGRAMEQVDAAGLGENVAAAVGQGQRNYSFDGDAEAMTQNDYNAMCNAAESHSPARRFIPIGNYISAGVGQGMREYSFAADAQTMTAAIEAATRAAMMTSGRTIGKQLTAGVAAGIRDGTSEAVAAAVASARQVTAAYKRELDIHSPSRVARDEIGLQFSRGVGLGIEKGMPDVLRIIHKSTEGLVSGAVSVARTDAYTVPINAQPMQAVNMIDYERLADAVASRPISFSVGAKQIAAATRDEAARQQALRVQQVNRSYGNGG